MQNRMFVRRAAILGASSLGIQIAAHFVNAKIPVLLYDIQHSRDSTTASKIVKQELKQMRPLVLASPELMDYIQVVTYEDHLPLLTSCDLIIDVLDERLASKAVLYQQLSLVLNQQAYLVTGSPSLNINKLAALLNQSQRERFCGLHFSVPLRTMQLIELVPHPACSIELINQVESFLVSILGKNVIRAKDGPYLIADRINLFSILTVFHHMQQYKLTVEDVDYLTSSKAGWNKIGIFRLLDSLGLETVADMINNMAEKLADDPWGHCYVVPAWLQQLLKSSANEEPKKANIYLKTNDVNHVWDIEQGKYRAANPTIDASAEVLFEIESISERFNTMRYVREPKIQFLWSCYRDIFHYCTFHLIDIADSVRDVDLALRWGAGWKVGPFETWQLAGWRKTAQWIEEDIIARNSLAKASLPSWVAQCANAYQGQTAFSPAKQTYIPRSPLAVYKRQLFPPKLNHESMNEGRTIFEDDDVRCWHMDDEIAILSFKSKHQTITPGVVEGLNRAVDVAEQNYKGLILWQQYGSNFSYGADLRFFTEILFNSPQHGAEIVKKFQQACLRMRYANIPTIAAIKGRVLGAGCELMMYCSRVVAGFESYIGLVEAAIGLSTSCGGCKTLVVNAQLNNPLDSFSLISIYSQQFINSYVSNNAIDAMQKGYLESDDVIVMNPEEILYVAKQQINAMSESAYQPPLPPMIKVLGKEAAARMLATLPKDNGRHTLSEHDYYLASRIIQLMCGGDNPAGSKISEAIFLAAETNLFLELAKHPVTQERIKRILNINTPHVISGVREHSK